MRRRQDKPENGRTQVRQVEKKVENGVARQVWRRWGGRQV